MSGGRGRRGGRSRGGGRSGGSGAVSPVEFNLHASQQFDLSDPPSALVVKSSGVPGARRLSIQHREALGDVLLWFAATAVAEPSARLVLWQGTRDDKTWLQGFVKENLPQIFIGEEVLPNGNKYVTFQLYPKAAAAGAKAAGLTPVEPVPTAAAAAAAEPAAEASAQQPAAAADSVRETVAHAAQQVQQSAAKAGHMAGQAAATAAQAVGQKVAETTEHAKEAAAAVVHKAQEAAKAAGDKVAAAAEHVNGGHQARTVEHSNQARGCWLTECSWFDRAQAAVKGEIGSHTQVLAIGGIAAGAVAVVGIVLAAVLGGKRKR